MDWNLKEKKHFVYKFNLAYSVLANFLLDLYIFNSLERENITD